MSSFLFITFLWQTLWADNNSTYSSQALMEEIPLDRGLPTLAANCHQLKIPPSEVLIVVFFFFFFFKYFFFQHLFIFGTEKDRAWTGEGQRERETQNRKQAPGSEPSAQSPTRGSNSRTSRTVRSWPGWSRTLNRPRHPGAPGTCFNQCQTEFSSGLFCFWSQKSQLLLHINCEGN